jgi:hypothetical protein
MFQELRQSYPDTPLIDLHDLTKKKDMYNYLTPWTDTVTRNIFHTAGLVMGDVHGAEIITQEPISPYDYKRLRAGTSGYDLYDRSLLLPRERAEVAPIQGRYQAINRAVTKRSRRGR